MIFAPHAATVDQWFLAFFPDARHWALRFIPGRFKHVAMFARVPPMKAWVWVEYTLFGFHVHLFPDTEAGRDQVFTLADGAGLICVKVQDMPAPRLRMGVTCVSLAKQALGLRSGAVSPTGLWRMLVSHPEARIIHDGIHEAQEAGPDRRGNRGAERAEGAADQRHATEPRL